MSKKKKFKKFSKAQILNIVEKKPSGQEQISAPKMVNDSKIKKNISPILSQTNKDTHQVKQDLIKISVLFVIILILLAGFSIINKRTNFLYNSTDAVFRVLNIN